MLRALLISWFFAASVRAGDPVLFAYFQEPAKTGVYFALSEDGYHFEALNGGKPWVPTREPGELMRDPFITRGPDGEFHMVWTWEWRVQWIGYAHSRDLVHWSEHRRLPLMESTPGTKNTWAPEIYWDELKKQWMIMWSSVVEGRHATNRMYYAYTPDFKTFSTPAIFLDPGYEVIDGTLMKHEGKYWLVFKDERPNPLHKEIKTAQSDSMTGPWTNMSEALTESWSEGPSIFKADDGRWVIYYDHYREPRRYEAIASRDLVHWVPITDQIKLPELCKHGSFLRVTQEEARRLRQGLAAETGSTSPMGLPGLPLAR